MFSASSPLPLLLLSNVVANIHQGCYPLLRAGLLQRPSHLRQYLKKQFVDVFNKNSNIHEPFIITYTMTVVDPALLEQLPRSTPGHSDMWCVMRSSSWILEVRPSTSFPTVQRLCM